jgi:hypothetical protein
MRNTGREDAVANAMRQTEQRERRQAARREDRTNGTLTHSNTVTMAELRNRAGA